MAGKGFELHPRFGRALAGHDIEELRLHVVAEGPCLELTLRGAGQVRRLRFFNPRDLRFRMQEAGVGFERFPNVYDVSDNGMEGVSVLVADDEGTAADAGLYLWASRVLEVEPTG
jgi:hypothetical protein